MKLKSLEILGFKSFANKTIFSFPANITAIVGPNGSGKSNIVDAIRWVLGERDLKSLRVARSDEIIFNGTASRPRMSIAQASIFLDNSDGSLPVDFKEIVISRKISRDGEAKYFINQSSVRLKDIVELLAKAKIGSQGLTIVNQGSTDAILKASPKERRAMIEENLGLREFQLKKEEAKRKLISTEENLDKTRALLEELRPHLKSLRRQVGKWERREEIVNNLQTFEKLFFGIKFQEIYKSKNKTEEEIKILKESLEKKEKFLADLEKEFEKLEKQRPDFSQEFKNLRIEIEKLEQEKGGILRNLGQIEGRIEGIKKLILPKSDFKPSLQELKRTLISIRDLVSKILTIDELEIVRRGLNTIIKKINAVFNKEELMEETNDEVKKLELERESLIKKIELLEEKIKEFSQKMDELRKKDEQTGSDARRILIAIEKQRSEIGFLNQKMNELILTQEKANLREGDLVMKLKEAGLDLAAFSFEKVKDLDIEEEMKQTNFNGSIDDLEMKILRLRHDLAAIGEVDEILLKEAKETEERYQFLSREITDLEKAKEDLSSIIKELTEKIDTQFTFYLKIINEEFNKYFRLMFGGGKAKLFLVKPTKINKKKEEKIFETTEQIEQEKKPSIDNLKKEKVTALDESHLERGEEKEIEPGIEFYIDLPKKKIKSLDVLSGGERSLVSISVLFAIVAVMKPPFIVLDEIDAALDEVNSYKFAKILTELVDKTQFIIITHNRATMEVAQVLYGISLVEEGISKAISLKFEEVAE